MTPENAVRLVADLLREHDDATADALPVVTMGSEQVVTTRGYHPRSTRAAEAIVRAAWKHDVRLRFDW